MLKILSIAMRFEKEEMQMHLEEARRHCRPVHITDRTPGIALISFNTTMNGDWLWLELFLSETEIGENGRSVFEDWAQILRATKNDISKAAVLRLNFDIVTPSELAGFRLQKKLATTNIDSNFGIERLKTKIEGVAVC